MLSCVILFSIVATMNLLTQGGGGVGGGFLAGEKWLLLHRSDSIRDIDYVANPFLLNLKVSRTTIENLR